MDPRPPADWERQIDVPHIRVTTSMRVLNAAPSPLRPHLLWNAENLAALK